MGAWGGPGASTSSTLDFNNFVRVAVCFEVIYEILSALHPLVFVFLVQRSQQ